MSEATTKHSLGLLCPNCGSPVDVAEGERVVSCAHCELPLYVQGERGIRRWMIQRTVSRAEAEKALRSFYSGMDRARDLKKTAALREIFLVYLPYWRIRAVTTGYACGNVKKDKDRRVPREVEYQSELVWTDAAVDDSEFGVHQLAQKNRRLVPYESDRIHAEGMVFQPTEAADEALAEAKTFFAAMASANHGLDTVFFERYFYLRPRIDLIHYPLWIARYTYRRRVYQVAVDGVSGEVLFGKAPGNVWYRALALAGGMALGNFLLVIVTAIALRILVEFEDGGALLLALAPLGLGLGLILQAYRIFRYSEEIEIRATAAERALDSVTERPSGTLEGGLAAIDDVLNTDLRRNLKL